MNQWVWFVAAGAAGGVVHDLLKHRRVLIWPRRWTNGKAKGVDTGTLGSIIIGIAAAVLVDHYPPTAFWAAIAGPEVLEQALKVNKNTTLGLIRRFIDAVDRDYEKP